MRLQRVRLSMYAHTTCKLSPSSKSQEYSACKNTIKKKKRILSFIQLGFPGGSVGKESACNAGDPGSISGLGRSPGEGNGNPLQYSCLENLMDRGAGQATVCRIVKSRTQLCDFHFTLHH